MSIATVLANRVRRAARGSAAAILCIGVASAAGAQELPVNFQGVALAPDGTPITGTRDLVIRIYDHATASAPANLFFSETHENTSFLDGVFAVSLGRGVISYGAPFGVRVFQDPQTPRWLELEIEGEILSPRTEFHALPYALMCSKAFDAERIAGLTPEDFVRGVSPGAGLTGGGTGEYLTLSVDFTQTQQRVLGTCPAESSIREIRADGSVACESDSAAAGDITAVTPGAGLVGGGSSGDVSLSIGTNLVTSAMIQNSTITSADIASDAIDSARIAAGAVTGSELAASSVGALQIADDSVGAAEIATGAVGTLEVENGSLRSIDLLDEPGSDSAGGGQLIDLTTADTVVRSVAIDAPAAGKVIVSASGTFNFPDPLTQQWAECSLSTSTAIDGARAFDAMELAPDSMFYVPFSSTRGFVVPAGPTTFYLVCKELPGLGEVKVINSEITAIFTSTVY